MLELLGMQVLFILSLREKEEQTNTKKKYAVHVSSKFNITSL
jgi:hypothetical protein